MNRGAALALVICAASPGVARALSVEGDAVAAEVTASSRVYSLLVSNRAGLPTETGEAAEKEEASAIERARLKLDGAFGESLTLEGALDLLTVIGSRSQVGLAVAPSNPLRISDLEDEIHGDDDWTLRYNLDRLFLRYVNPNFVADIGRQAIGFGSARLFSSADLFANFNPASIDNEFKRGLDAVKIAVPIGESNQLEAIVIVNGVDVTKSFVLARWRTMGDAFDLATYGGTTYARPTLGLDISGDLGGAGWYLEGSARFDPDAFDDSEYRATLGIDYRFESTAQVTVEGHYNGVGAAEPSGYFGVFDGLAYQVGEAYLLSEWYFGAALGAEITPLFKVQVGWIQNLADGSGLFSPGLSWDFSEAITLGVGAIVPVGARARFNEFGVPLVQSEFGLYPSVLYTDLSIAL